MSWVNPVAGRISSKYGQRKHPITGKASLHGGTDIAAATGTSVKAVAAGTVAVTWNSLAGNKILVTHAGGIVTTYHHLSAVSVKSGQKVKAGQVIGRVGMTGSATGPHLHFEVHRNGTRVDPQPFMRSKGIELGTNKPIKTTSGGMDVAKLPIVRPGARSVAAGRVQGLLLASGYSVGKWGVDKVFGKASVAALEKFQKAKGLKPDGVAGEKTWPKLLGI